MARSSEETLKYYVIVAWDRTTTTTTSWYRPFQLDGVTRDGENVSVREMYGHLCIKVNGVIVYQAYDVPETWDFEDLQRLTADFIVWAPPIIKDQRRTSPADHNTPQTVLANWLTDSPPSMHPRHPCNH
jgi:hypothetical protein